MGIEHMFQAIPLSPRALDYLTSLTGYKFKVLLEHMHLTFKKNTPKPSEEQLRVRQTILENVSELHPFVIFPSAEALQKPLPIDFTAVEASLLDLPFRTCSFELAGDMSSSIMGLPVRDADGVTILSETGHIRITNCPVVIVHELSPQCYMYAALEAWDDQVSVSFWEEKISMETAGILRASPIMKSILKRFLGQDTGTTSGRVKMRLGMGNARSLVKPKKVVFLGDRHSNKCCPATGTTIMWSHRWEVRGHWRVVSGVGKDREGAYSVPGHTWVMPHVKGLGELVKKVRITRSRDEHRRDFGGGLA